MAEPVSPALAASQAPSVPSALLNASTPSIVASAAAPVQIKKAPPKQGDAFESSLGYGGRGCDPLASVADVDGEDAAGAAKLMKNLLFAPTHRSYEKMAQTKGHAPTAAELKCTAYVLPAICRDSTKFSRPVVPLLRVFDNCDVQLTYVIYGNEAAPGNTNYILYNLDKTHGVALSANIRRVVGLSALWCKPELVDYQVRYIFTSLIAGFSHLGMTLAAAEDWESLYKIMKDAKKMSIGLLVVDGLSESSCKALRGAHVPSVGGGIHNEKSPEYLALQTIDQQLTTQCCDSYAKPRLLYPLLDGALLKLKNRLPAPAPDAPERQLGGSRKRPRAAESDNDSDSEMPVVMADRLPKETKVPAAAAKPVEVSTGPKKKKKREEDDDEEEMSDSGSDSGTGSESDEEESDEEDDSEEEDEDESDDDEPKKTKKAATPAPSLEAPRVSSFVPAPPQVRKDPDKRVAAKSLQKPEKEKRKPAKSRRQSMEKTISGILRQGKGLDDAVPAQNQDKLAARIAEVEKTLRPFVDEGKVVHVHDLLHSSWGLVSELFTIVNAIGRAGGPAPPDSAVSRRLALSMGRLFDNESKDIEDLSRDLAGWASKMASIVATRAQVALQNDQDSRQLVPPRV